MFEAHHFTTLIEKPSNPFSAIKTVNRSPHLSKGAKILYSTLRLSAGTAGRIKFRIHRLAEETAASISSTKEYLTELKTAGLVIGEHRPGRANLWHVFDPEPKQAGEGQGSQPTGQGVAEAPATILKDVQEKTLERTVEPPPIREAAPPQTERNVFHSSQKKKPEPFDTELLREILDATGDTKSRKFWIRTVNQVPEQEIRIGLDALRTAELDGTILAKPGAYLHSVLKNRNPAAFGAPSSTPRPSPNTAPTIIADVGRGHTEPITEPATHEIAMAALAEIRGILGKGKRSLDRT